MSELDSFFVRMGGHSTYDVSRRYVERFSFNFPGGSQVYGSHPTPAEPLVEIFRLPPATEKRFNIIAAGVCSLQTHWAAFTRICAGADCPWCAEGFERIWRGYVAAVASPAKAGLLEITAATFDEWESALSSGELYCHIVTVSRHSRYSGVRPLLATKEKGPVWPIVDTDTVFDRLCRVLRLPRRSASVDRDSWLEAVRQHAIASGPTISLKAHAG
jgi:hypothetical protein